jgi:hypothetical protein
MKALPKPEYYRGGSSLGAEGSPVLAALLVHLRESRVGMCEEWRRRIEEEELFTLENKESILAGTLPAFDDYVEALATGRARALEEYSGVIAERFIASGAESHEVVEIVYLLRTALVASLFRRFRHEEDWQEDAAHAQDAEIAGTRHGTS